MKKIVLLLSFLISVNFSFAQKSVLTDTLYWFYIKMDVVKEDGFQRNIHEYVKVYSKIYSGNGKEFIKAQKEKMRKGKVAIGPFEKMEDANISFEFYANKNSTELSEKEKLQTEYFFYTTKILKAANGKSLEFYKIPTSINFNNISYIKNLMAETKLYLILTMGLFSTKEAAQNSLAITQKLQKE